MSPKRFTVYGGARGYLSAAPVGSLPVTPGRWQPLFNVNRPMSPALVAAAQRAALRRFEVS